MFTIDPILIFELIVLIFSVMIHEIAHGSVAYTLGDSTAKDEGRLTLNPIKHVDLFGSIILPLALLLSSTLFPGGGGLIFGWAKPVPVNPHNFRDQKWGSLKVALAGPATNLLIAVIFGLIIRFAGLSVFSSFGGLLAIVVSMNLSLALFNLIPIPPLDGSHILFAFLPIRNYQVQAMVQQYGMILLLLVLFSGGLYFLNNIISSFFLVITGTAI